jgi:hypothetical protein
VTTDAADRWHLLRDGREHEVEIAEDGLRRRVTWRTDGTEVAATSTTDRRVVLAGGARGAVRVRLSELSGTARRVTWFADDGPAGAEAAAHVGVGGVDLRPVAGTGAAERDAWIRDHGRAFTLRRTAAAVAGVLLPVLLLWLLSRVHLPWPDWQLPRIPWPDWDLPRIPWPDWHLPRIPWPDWDLPRVPDWVRELREKARYVVPVIVAFVVARGEVRRRRRLHEESADRAPESPDRSDGEGPAESR